MKNKVLIIYDSILQDFVKYMEQDSRVLVFSTYDNLNLFLKLCRRFWFWLSPHKVIWYGGWKYKLGDVDTVIVFANTEYDHINFIKRSNPKLRVIVWFWNPISKCFNPNLVDEGCEKFSFDKEDCKKFNLSFNSTFYFKDIKALSSTKEFDVVFIGNDKGRKSTIEKVKEFLILNNFVVFFQIFNEKKKTKGKEEKISYNEYLEKVSKSKCILDIVQEGQSGLTIRVMESLFLGKKLITNNRSIKELDFYSKKNVFILELDDLAELGPFLLSEEVVFSEKDLEFFEFSRWLDRFFINEN